MKLTKTAGILLGGVLLAVITITFVLVNRESAADRLLKEKQARAKEETAAMNEMNRRDMETYKIDTSPVDTSGFKPFGNAKPVKNEPQSDGRAAGVKP